jgi:hypothetical protein
MRIAVGAFPGFARTGCRMAAFATCASAAPLALADAGVQWRLEAHIPVICSVQSITQNPADDRQITIETLCNLERYAIAFDIADAPARVQAARVTGATAVIAPGRIEITALRPGTAQIEILLAQPPAEGRMTAAIVPL